jgi:RHS repeat-associated protein
LTVILAIGPCLALAAPSRETKAPYHPVKTLKRVGSKIAQPRPVPAQASAFQPGQTVTLLPDGRSLLIGGEENGNPVATAAISDIRSGVPVPLTAKLNRARAWHSATMLPDGRVLVVGGVGANGRVVRSAEIFNPQTQAFSLLPESEGTARAYHTATLLMDGKVLIVGGSVGHGPTSDKALLYDFKTGTFTSLSNTLSTGRQKHRAILLHDGNVLIDGGRGDDSKQIDVAELYNADAGTFSLSNISADQANLRDPILTASLPGNGARDVTVNAFAGLIFSRQFRVETINSETLVLSGPEGVVKTRVVPAENGKLAFVTAVEPLLPGVTYTINVSGVMDAGNQIITPASVSFTTKGEPENEVTGANSEDWIPDEGNLHGSWRSKFKDSQWRSLPPLQAKEGETALAGQTLMLDGKPLNNVTLRIGNNTALTDNTGRFLLTGISSGHQVLTIDGRTANRNGRSYGIFRVGVEINQSKTTALEYTIWMTKLDVARAKKIPSPTTSRTVVTNPRIPGLELILPTGTVIRDTEGQNVTQISITPIPTNQPPFPLPPGIDVPVYFTVQPGGSQIIPPRAQLIYPNFIGSKPGTRIDFWNYDPTGKGWYVYGQGTVTADGRQIVPDPGVVLYEFSGAMVGSPSFAPLDALIDALMGDGDPVNLGSGLLVVQKLDLVLPDTIPVTFTRTYRQNDSRSRAFGIGASHPYDIFLVGNTFPYTFQDLVLANGERIHYDRTSPGVGAGDAIYENLTEPGPFFKSRISANGDGWNLTLTDGTVYVFPDGFTASQPWQCALLRIQDRYGNVVQLDRDTEKKLTKITTPHNRWIQFTYDTSARITQAADNIGRTVGYTYDASGRLWKVTDPNNGVTEYTYDTSHRMLTIKDPRGIVYLTNEYDTSGRVIKQTLADDTPANSTDNPTYLFNYTTDSGGRIVQTDVTDPRGHVRRVTFDTTGYSLTDTSAVGTPEQQSVSFEREAGTNLVRAIVDPLGRRSEFNYDSFGGVTSAIQFAGTASAATTSFTYDPAFHQLATVTDALNHTTTYTHDSSGNLISIANALNQLTTFTYDSKGRVTSITDPLFHTTQFVYEGGDLSGIIDPLNRILSRFTDAVGRVIQVSNTSGNRTRFEYDSLNQVRKIIEHSGGITELTYDGNGNVLTLKDARNQTTNCVYDNMDRLISYTDSLQGSTSTETLEYDLNGNPVRAVDRRGKVKTTTYDALDRPTFVGFGTTAGLNYESSIGYTYDLYDRITQAVDSISGTTDFVFDDLNRTASETSPRGSVGFTYDKVGRLISQTVTGQPSTSYSYDNANRLSTISQGLATVGFTYDTAGRRATLTPPNGVVTEYGYDAASQLTSLTYRSGATTIGDLTYSYDQNGRRKTMGGSLARTGLPQPLSVANYDAANRLTQRGAATLSYDANGNLTNDGTNTYTWDARNQLVSISGAVSANFQYDPFGRRVRTTINGSTTDYLYDGANVVQEQIGGTPSANLLTGGVDEVFSRMESGGTQSVLADGLGSTLALLNSAGVTQTEYSYEPFGNTNITGAGSSNASQFTGRENDGTGLYYYRARYYSPTLQRFISEDPANFGGGDTNLYAYVANSPCTATDPSGKFFAEACLFGMLDAAIDGLLSGRKFSPKELVKGCAHGVVFALAGAALFEGLAFLSEFAGGLRGAGTALEEASGVGPPRGPQCFVAGTLIQTAAGAKPIEEVRAGDIVLSSEPERTDSSSLRPQSQTVTQTFQRVATEVVDIHIGKTTITTTLEHPFWVVGAGWTAAGELRRGSALLTKDGLVVHVDTIERREGKFKVYNFEVGVTHTYYVGAAGVLVHNACTPYRPPRPLPRAPNGRPIPESPFPHTQLGERTPKGGYPSYPQAREFGPNGKPVRDIDFTDHGQPQYHTNPHQHPYDPVTGKRKAPIPFP